MVVVVVMAVVLLDPHAADHACCCGGRSQSQVQAVRLSGAGTRVTLIIALAHPAIGAAGS